MAGCNRFSGNAVYIHYVGFSASTGEQFDSSWDRGRTEFIGYVSGIGNVIEGLDQGLLGMQVEAEAVTLLMVYGENGAGDGLIAPGETLIFIVDLLARTAASYLETPKRSKAACVLSSSWGTRTPFT